MLRDKSIKLDTGELKRIHKVCLKFYFSRGVVGLVPCTFALTKHTLSSPVPTQSLNLRWCLAGGGE